MKEDLVYFESDLANLEKARKFITDKANEASINAADLIKIEISCDEWCANIIEYGIKNNDKKGFTIQCKCIADKFIVIYEHQGAKFNPINRGVVDLNKHFTEMKERGLGLYIMREMMDEIHYEYVDNKLNRLTLVKYLNTNEIETL
jgi:serine/threonine-protein kinase RsbW